MSMSFDGNLRIYPGTIITGQWSKKEFVVLRPLGKGGFGMVYLVKSLQFGEQKALKVSRDMLTLAREFNVLEKLQNVAGGIKLVPRVELMDDSEILGRKAFFIVMEFIDGINLRSFLRSRKFSLPEAHILVKLLGVLLNHLHQYGYVYCDLKPENILFDKKQGVMRLVDFGGVREVGSWVLQFTPAFDRASYGCGTRKADPGYDAFALSALMVALITGRDPQPQHPFLPKGHGALAVLWKKAIENKYTDVKALLHECEACLQNTSCLSSGERAAIYCTGLVSAGIFAVTLTHLLR